MKVCGWRDAETVFTSLQAVCGQWAAAGESYTRYDVEERAIQQTWESGSVKSVIGCEELELRPWETKAKNDRIMV
jgi:hypothetical protein